MPKTLVIAEKPSVGRDLVRVLPGPFTKHEGYLEGPEHVVTWAVGHLVQLADPDEYDDRFKKWRMADLPIVPDRFKLVVRDERSKKQMTVVKRQLDRSDVDLVVNACDAGREGELIFAYLYEKAGSKKPVMRLWLNSMTNEAIRDAFGSLRPGLELATLEAAARSRSEADWIVGMNATRAATIRLRSSFDGAVSLGRVQTPTLAILARREQEIRDFKPEPYWVVDAVFDPVQDKPRIYEGRYHDGANPRVKTADVARGDRRGRRGSDRRDHQAREDRAQGAPAAPLRPDLAPARRQQPLRVHRAAHAFGRAAPVRGAQGSDLPPHELALHHRRHDPGDQADRSLVGAQAEYAKASEYVVGLEKLPLGRVVNDEKVTDHHAIIPTRAERHPVDKMSDDDRRIYDLVVRRFLAIFHPDAVFENTRVETTVAGHVFRTRGKVLLVAGWRAVYGEMPDAEQADDDEGREQQLPKLVKGELAEVEKVASEEKETKPPRRYTEGSLLAAMETAGKLVDEEELREAMKDSGIGTPATRAAIIERLIQVGYIERDGRALVVTEKGLNVIRLLGEHALTSPGLTGDWERRLALIETGADSREAFMGDIVRFTQDTVGELDRNLKDVRIPRANLGPCPVCGRDIVENRKGYSCWSREDPGCGFVIWKSKAGKQLPVSVARELIKTGRTEKPVTGFKGRSGKSFRARLALQQTDDGKWRVEFDEPWAREGAKPPEADEPETPAETAEQPEAA